MSFAYLNNEKEIDEGIENLNKIARNGQNKINAYKENRDIPKIKEGNPIYELCNLRNLGGLSLKRRSEI